MNFRSDHIVGVAPAIMEAIVAANQGSVDSYGDDPYSGELTRRMSSLFETEVVVMPVISGTAANALSLSILCPSHGTIYAHETAHIEEDECGAPEFYTGGGKLTLIPGADGRMDLDALEHRLATAPKGFVHSVQPAAVSVTQLTEAGTVYSLDQIRRVGALAREHGLGVHMDGARFANAVVSLGCAPADITWRAGVDVLSFGGTKNGCMGAEAIVLFKPEMAERLAYLRKRGGHLVPKMRFIAAQLVAYLSDDLWLNNARHANAQAKRLAEGLGAIEGASLRHPVDGNEVFVTLPLAVIEGLEAAGAQFYRWGDPADATIRLVTSWATASGDVDRLLATAEKIANSL